MLVFNPEILAKSIDTENNEIVFEDFFMIEKSEKSNPDDPKFEYFKKLVMDHLAELEKKENKTIAKAIDICEYIQKSKFPVGTIRNWNGGKFKKISPDKWVRVYDKETRGAKLAIAALRRKAAACTNSEELLQLVLVNKERFVDNAGKPLPFMQEFSAYVSGLNDMSEKNVVNNKKVDDIWDKLKSREKELRKKGYSDDQVDNDKEYKKLKGEMSKVGEVEPKTENKDSAKNLSDKETVDYSKMSDDELKELNTKLRSELKEKDYSEADEIMNQLNAISKQQSINVYKTKERHTLQYIEGVEQKEKILANSIAITEKDLATKQKQRKKETNVAKKNKLTDEVRELEYKKAALEQIEKEIKEDRKAVNSDNPKKLTTATKEEVKQFLSDTIDTTKDRRISLGEVSESAKKRIKDKTGKDVNRIILDSGEIRHAMKKTAHNIELSDLERIGEIVNSTNDITLEDKKHQNNDVIRFVEEVDNGINLVMEFRAKKGDLSLVTAYREKRADAPMKNPGQTSETLRTSNSNIPQKEEKSSDKKGIEAIRNKYQSSKSIEGDEDEIYVGKETITGKWKLVEADAPSASHDEITFRKTEGFPTGKDGATVNNRDYEHDTAAQEAVIDIAADYDGRALGLDSPVIVTQDGVVTSGNNRTMSSKIAARKGTDTKYIEALKKRAGKFGFTADDVAQFKHPRVVFETEHKGDYTTSEFAKFNESGKKAMNPVEKAVKVSKLIKPQTIEQIAENISEFDTMGDLYADKKATRDIFNTLIESDIIQKTDLPQYYADNAITAAGKEFLETVLIGSVVDENNIRQLNTEGGKSIRQKLVRAITPLIENKGMKGYSINKELNEAVGIAVEVAHNKDKFADVEDYGRQTDMFRKLDPVSIELAKKLEGTQKSFAEFMLEMNGGLRPAANGEADIFLGGTESKEDIVNRILHIKKAVQKALKSFVSHIFDK